ncbi:hypothetical protein BC332_34952 [Capsicum chinense]|nr:hypothetical protein BC332_34952 [Capsicum chinense]
MTPLDAALHKGNRACAKYLQLHGGVPASKLTSHSAALRGPHRFIGVLSRLRACDWLDNRLVINHLDALLACLLFGRSELNILPRHSYNQPIAWLNSIFVALLQKQLQREG